MIIINEVVHPGEVHIEINSSLLEIIKNIYPNEQITYRAEREQINVISNHVKPSDKIKFISFHGYYDPKKYSWLVRICGEIKQIYKSLKIGRKLRANIYLWTCLFPTGHLFLSLYLLLFNKNAKHIIVLHGELEFLKVENRRISEMVLGLILKFSIEISRKNTIYIVLGDRIRDHMKTYVSNCLLKRVISILHPYRYEENIPIRIFENNFKPIIFGSIGTQMIWKNSFCIFKLAQMLEDEVMNGNMSFVTIGKVLPEITPFENKLVRQLYESSFVPQSVFETEIKKLNFALFFYDNNSYQLCASGAVYEVIKLGLPIISIYNDYFDWLFQKYGSMGFLCNSLDEMRSLSTQIKTGSLDVEINIILKRISEFKIQNNLKSIAADLSEKI